MHLPPRSGDPFSPGEAKYAFGVRHLNEAQQFSFTFAKSMLQ
jgi:hypothetical protein